MRPIDAVLDALSSAGCRVTRTGSGWSCQCPAHDDSTPSLSLMEGGDGRALLHCHAGCGTDAVLSALGLAWSSVMPTEDDREGRPRVPVPNTPDHGATGEGFADGDKGTRSGRTYADGAEAVAALEARHGPRSADWTYVDAAGEVVGLILRWDAPGGKKRIVPVSRRGAGWAVKGMPTPRPVYGLPDLLATPPETPVYVVEGEKTVDAARSIGLTATTSAHGSKSAKQTDWSPLSGREVVILPDRDDAGEQYADTVAALARSAGAHRVQIARLSERWPELPAGGDLVDVLEAEGGDADAIRSGIESLLDEDDDAAEPVADSGEFAPFPTDILPEPVRKYVREGAAAIGCDESYVAVPLLAGLAGAIGNTHVIELKSGWTAPSILWAGLVGESGTAKSPAMRFALEPVRSRQRAAMKEHEAALAEWEIANERWEEERAARKRGKSKQGDGPDRSTAPPRPVCPRTWTDDATTEAIIVKLKENPRGLLMIRDELAGWFDFGRYNKGGGEGEYSKWLEVYDGGSLIVDRVTRETLYVERASVSIAGGIQPGILRRVLRQKHFDSGLAARLLLVMPPRMPRRWTDREVPESTVREMHRVFDRLYELEPRLDDLGDPTPHHLPLTQEARGCIARFVDEHGEAQMQHTGALAAAYSKLEAYAARFALVIHLVRLVADDPTLEFAARVDEASVQTGIVLARWFTHEVERVYHVLRETEEECEMRRLVEWVRQRGGKTTRRQLTKNNRAYRGKTDKAQADLDRIAEAGLGRWEHPAPGSKGGRPSSVFVLNPIATVPKTPMQDGASSGFDDGDKQAAADWGIL